MLNIFINFSREDPWLAFINGWCCEDSSFFKLQQHLYIEIKLNQMNYFFTNADLFLYDIWVSLAKSKKSILPLRYFQWFHSIRWIERTRGASGRESLTPCDERMPPKRSQCIRTKPNIAYCFHFAIVYSMYNNVFVQRKVHCKFSNCLSPEHLATSLHPRIKWKKNIVMTRWGKMMGNRWHRQYKN